VIVDLTHFDRGILVRCAPPPVASGFDALRRVGFEVTGTQRYPGLLCRIDGEPADQQCVQAPPAGAYWAYWHAPRGGDWTYSTSGASRRPPAGSVEGWAFGAKAEPAIAPPAPLPASTTTTRPSTSTPTTAPTGALPDSATAGPTTERRAPAAPAEAPGASTTTTSSGDEDVASAAPHEDGEIDGDEELLGAPVVAAPAGAEDEGGGGSPLAAIATVAVLASVVVGVGLWRRVARPGGDDGG
jgi:hypothetical protein